MSARASDRSAPRGAWVAVGLLWMCGFFNYADRQAVFAVFPLLKSEFGLDDTAKGMVGSAFMVVYALASPFTGLLVDRFARRWLVAGGLGIWSVICALTATARSFPALLFYRSAEGLGESCYFPSAMSLLADHHGPATRSRAMSLHQTSVYAGTALGALIAGILGARFGWRAPFVVLGVLGGIYALCLPWLLKEPVRGGAEADLEPRGTRSWWRDVGDVLGAPSALALLGAFACANFVASAFLTWLADYAYRSFVGNLEGAAVLAGLPWPTANMVGALLGGVAADWMVRRHRGGRALVQGAGLLLGAPWVFLVSATESTTVLVIALLAAGLCKGLYDANIFAALYDVVPARVRGVAAGLMNTVGWTGGLLAPVVVGVWSDRGGLSRALGGLATFYVIEGALALVAAVL